MAALKEWGLHLDDIVGQGYDGAASMSSERVGLQARIRAEAPLAVYVHCSGHSLNLVIALAAVCHASETHYIV